MCPPISKISSATPDDLKYLSICISKELINV